MVLKRYRRRRVATLVISTIMAVFYIFLRLKDLQSHDKVTQVHKKRVVTEPTHLTTELQVSPVRFNINYNLTIPNDGPIVVITSNMAFLDFAQNWVESVRRLDTHPHILAIAEDLVAYRTLSRYSNITTVLTQRAPSPQKTLVYLSRDYRVLVNKRPVYIYRLLAKGRDVLFSDVDTVWLRDPLPYMDGDYDVVLQEDLREPEMVVYCAGFIFFRATDASRALVFEWNNRIHRRRDSQPDQRILNELLAERFANVRFKVLDSALFPNGKLYFNPEWRDTQTVKPVIVHNNWIEDHEEKVERFRKHGFWYI